MNQHTSFSAQRGATLIVGLIMLVLITLMVTGAFTQSNSNLKSVGNMQFRNEALSAANKAIEQVLGGDFFTAPVAQEINVDINSDNKNDYTVKIATPSCVNAVALPVAPTEGHKSSVTLPASTTSSVYNTVWDIDATVTDTTSGASVRVHQGVRKQLASGC